MAYLSINTFLFAYLFIYLFFLIYMYIYIYIKLHVCRSKDIDKLYTMVPPLLVGFHLKFECNFGIWLCLFMVVPSLPMLLAFPLGVLFWVFNLELFLISGNCIWPSVAPETAHFRHWQTRYHLLCTAWSLLSDVCWPLVGSWWCCQVGRNQQQPSAAGWLDCGAMLDRVLSGKKIKL